MTRSLLFRLEECLKSGPALSRLGADAFRRVLIDQSAEELAFHSSGAVPARTVLPDLVMKFLHVGRRSRDRLLAIGRVMSLLGCDKVTCSLPFDVVVCLALVTIGSLRLLVGVASLASRTQMRQLRGTERFRADRGFKVSLCRSRISSSRRFGCSWVVRSVASRRLQLPRHSTAWIPVRELLRCQSAILMSRGATQSPATGAQAPSRVHSEHTEPALRVCPRARLCCLLVRIGELHELLRLPSHGKMMSVFTLLLASRSMPTPCGGDEIRPCEFPCLGGSDFGTARKFV